MATNAIYNKAINFIQSEIGESYHRYNHYNEWMRGLVRGYVGYLNKFYTETHSEYKMKSYFDNEFKMSIKEMFIAEKKNKQKLTDMVNETVKDFNKSIVADKKYLELEKSNQWFKKMVARGLIKERGNNLLSSSEITDKNRGSFNVREEDSDKMI